MSKATKVTKTQPAGIRIPGFDLRLHRGVRSVAADLGIPARTLYETIVRAYLIQVGKLTD